jgi:hypothetical protein
MVPSRAPKSKNFEPYIMGLGGLVARNNLRGTTGLFGGEGLYIFVFSEVTNRYEEELKCPS